MASSIAFVAVPAHSQMGFIAGADLIGSILVIILIRIFATWVVKTEFAQMTLRNMTKSAEKQLQAGKSLNEPWVHPNEL